MLLEEAYRPVTTIDGDRPVQVPILLAALRSMVTKAAKGDARSQRMLLDHVTAIEAEQRRDRAKFFEAVATYKVEGAQAIAAAKAGGLPEPELLPHPDHLIVHPLHGTVILRGPVTAEEKARWEETTLLRQDIDGTLKHLTRQQAAAPGDAGLARRIEAHRRVIGRIDDFLRNFERVIMAGAGC